MFLVLLSLVLSLVLVDAQGQCVTPSQQQGKCIYVKDCTEIYNVIGTQQLTPNKIKYFRQIQCGKHNGQVLVCCPGTRQINQQNLQRPQLPKQSNRPLEQGLIFSSLLKPGASQPIQQNLQRPQPQKQLNSRPPTQGLTFSSLLKPESGQPIQQIDLRILTPQQQSRKPPTQGSSSSLFPKPGVCGKGAPNKIYGGVVTDIGEYPWLALIEYSNGGNSYGFLCGGSLINNRYVLTAAHCIKSVAIPTDLSIISVRLGEWNTDTAIDCKTDINGNKNCADPPINIPIESSIMHENYIGTPTNKNHDIALIRLSKTVPYTQFISPVCLPLSTNLRTSNLDGSIFVVVGWGKTESKSSSNVKLKASVSAIDLGTCKSIFAQSKVILNNGQICAGGKKGVDSCSGDSGGPLIGIDNSNNKQSNYFLAGIVSFGIKKCGSEGWPGVYTRVGNYIDWIEKNMTP